jgi:hypothetical protein
MGEWVFPNPLAESIRKTAVLRGQHANRIEIRDFADRWPDFVRVSPMERCPAAAGLMAHEGSVVKQGERVFEDPFCRSCGRLVAGR